MRAIDHRVTDLVDQLESGETPIVPPEEQFLLDRALDVYRRLHFLET